MQGRPDPDAELRRALARQRAIATMLLVLMGGILVGSYWLEPGYWRDLIQASAKAGLVGGIADWFAVTALFRHPLGLRIPHTAIVPSRKDRIGAALGNFVQRFFLAPDVVTAKLAAAHPAQRLGAWLAVPANAHRVSGQLAAVLHRGAALLRDEDVQRVVDRGIMARLRGVPAAPLAARALELLTEGGRHHALLDDALRLLARLLEE
ncbi:MAG: DUF445 family protein, partial [Acetobacteraceae bacterium]